MIHPIPTQLRIHARQRPQKIAIIDRERTFTYAVLDRMIDYVAHRLVREGLGYGDLVGVALNDRAEHLVMLVALGRIGAIVLPLDARWPPGDIADVARKFGAVRVLHESTHGENGWQRIDGGWFGESDNPYEEPRVTLDTPMVLSLSSGTTGTPKGPRTSHGKFIARFTLFWMDFGLSGRDVFLTATPLYFGGGRAFALAMLYAGGTSALFCPPYKPQDLVNYAERIGATATFLVPTLLRRLAALEGETLLLPTIRTLISSGAAIYPQELQAVRARVSPYVFQYYSSTEGGGCSVLTPEMFEGHSDSIGQPCFGVEVEVVDAEHRPVAAGEIGRLRYRSDASAQDYYRGEDSSAFHDGWFYPGDLGSIDNEGFLFLRGRIKDIIIRGGVNIYPGDIEAVLTGLDGVADAAVIGVPSPEFGEAICAFVVAPGVAEDDLRTGCAEHLARYKVPSLFRFVGELPRSGIGKVDKAALLSLSATDGADSR
jgi:acyl-CoA synthetase (AMP-forming)/AMP-acid ligase II